MKETSINQKKAAQGGESSPPVSVSKFRDICGISNVTFWRWEKSGLIQTVRLAGRKYITGDAMREFNRRLKAGELAGNFKPFGKES